MTAAQRVRGLAVDRGGAIALAALVSTSGSRRAISSTATTAEFATIGAIGGVPHPSGYPLYVLWLRLTSWLPGASPHTRRRIATAVLGAATMLVLHAACRAWGARPLAATIAVALYAAAPVVLRMFTEAEVFALNGLVVATVLWLSAQRRSASRGMARAGARARRRARLSNHMTCVLVAPIGCSA